MGVRIPDPVLTLPQCDGVMGHKLLHLFEPGFLSCPMCPGLCGHQTSNKTKGAGGRRKVTAIAFKGKASETYLKCVSDAKLQPEVTYLKGFQ